MTDALVRVVVVDHVPLYSEGLLQALAGTRFRVVARTRSAERLPALVAEWCPDILILEISGSANLIAAAAAAMQKRDRMKVVALTASDSQDDVVEALRSGFHGYILKGVTAPELRAALEAVHSGQPYISHELTLRLLTQHKSARVTSPGAPEEFKLTHREKEILVHLCNGLTNREIAAHLGVSVATMKFYVTGIFKKLNVRNRVEALIKAQQMGLAQTVSS